MADIKNALNTIGYKTVFVEKLYKNNELNNMIYSDSIAELNNLKKNPELNKIKSIVIVLDNPNLY